MLESAQYPRERVRQMQKVCIDYVPTIRAYWHVSCEAAPHFQNIKAWIMHLQCIVTLNES